MTKRTIAAAALVCVLSGCAGLTRPASSPAAAPVDQFLDQRGYEHALRTAYQDFAWPTGYRPNLARLAADSGPPPNARVQAGSEKMVLGMVNSCAWYLSWNTAHKTGRRTDAAHALDVMQHQLPALAPDQTAGRQLAEDIARTAADDNSAPALAFVRNNCSNIQWTG